MNGNNKLFSYYLSSEALSLLHGKSSRKLPTENLFDALSLSFVCVCARTRAHCEEENKKRRETNKASHG